jgi:hypothetical protein
MAKAQGIDVAIIGAGPYGLSVAAYLRHCGVEHLVFGAPMQMWREHMPAGMLLKSRSDATNLAAPLPFTLDEYCRATRYPRTRVSRETMIGYGLEFQARYVPSVDHDPIARVTRAGVGFRLETAHGRNFEARRVVVASGLRAFAYQPPSLCMIPAECRSHSSDRSDLSVFRGHRVAVLGGGQSALETAALLNEAGALVRLIARRPIRWFSDQIGPLRPDGPIGPGWRAQFWSRPSLCRLLPLHLRATMAYSTFGPGGTEWLRPRLIGLPVDIGKLDYVELTRTGVDLLVSNGAKLSVDHVISATGYRADLRQLDFLAPLHDAIDCYGTDRLLPVLNGRFESSVNGLHFIGFISAASFGPAMRFVYGAGFAAERIARALAPRGRHRALVTERPTPVAGASLSGRA